MTLLLFVTVALLLVLKTRQHQKACRELEQLSRQLQARELSDRSQFAASSTVMLVLERKTGRLLELNSAAVAFYGYSRETLLAMSLTDLDVADFPADSAALDSVECSRGQRFAFRHRLADGSVRDVEAAISRIVFDGRDAFHAIITDITERNQNDQARRELEQRLSYALHATGDGVWDWEIPTGKVKHNSRWCELLGLDSRFLVHELSEFAARIHADDRERVLEAIQAATDGKSPYQSYHRMVRSDATMLWVYDRGRVVERDSDGRPTRMVGAMVDISAQKRAEDALRQNEAMLGLAMDLAQIGHWEFDVATATFTFDDRFYALYATTTAAEGGTQMSAQAYVQRFLPTEEAPLVFQDIAEAVKNSGPRTAHQLEHRVIRRDGEERFVCVRYFVERNDSGNAVRLFGANQDITERKQVEAALLASNSSLHDATNRANQLAHQAELANRAKSEFLANMSHELRTPMNGVIGMTELLLDTKLDEEQRRYTEVVLNSAQSLLGLLNDILDLSKIEAGKLELEDLDFSLRELVDQLSLTHGLRAYDKGLDFAVDVAPQIPDRLRGDPNRLRQVLTNLIGNAIKFTTKGEVVVRVVAESETSDQVMLRFSVTDTGIGIPSDKQHLLFQKFTQIDASTIRQFGGTGLGLAISKQLAELLGGEIGVRIPESTGAEFWFTAKFMQQANQPTPTEALDLQEFGRILVVDKSRHCQLMLEAQLRAWGGRVDCAAADARSAIEALRKAAMDEPYRVALVDEELLAESECEPLRSIRKTANMLGTQLITMTRLAKRPDTGTPSTSEQNTALTKPICHGDLTNLFSVLLSGAASKRSSMVTRTPLQDPGSTTEKRILLVEDNLVNQMVTRIILEKLGCQVDIANNGLEALDAVSEVSYDLILMDVQMPELDGLRAATLIRAAACNATAPNTPIVAMTANAMQGDREECVSAGMNDYVTKPVSPRELADVLGKWLGPR